MQTNVLFPTFSWKNVRALTSPTLLYSVINVDSTAVLFAMLVGGGLYRIRGNVFEALLGYLFLITVNVFSFISTDVLIVLF